ncbi:MAG: hypothetical protein ACR2GC_09780 [Methyloceanibacter sp.]|uniref:hypothetical protein n=1 Tax=Methyloceanibacter sp. TaxID=1965321 RepID=UPI003D9BA916
MRIVMATALASALLFAVAQTAQAAPLLNLQDGAQSPAGMVDLVRKGGGGGKGFKGGGGGGKAFRGGGLSSKSFKGGRSFSRSYAGKSFKGGKSYRGGSWARSGGNRGNYGKGKYAGRGYYNKGRYYRRGYPYFWGGLAVTGAYYGSNCGWLYRQAQATGSAYWWQRYQDCVYYY